MNANKQDAGGLPLLQFAVFDEFGKGADDRVWDYGRLCFEAGRELCRAAPAGGEDSLFTPSEHLAACREDWQRVCDALGSNGRHMDPSDVLKAISDLRTSTRGLYEQLRVEIDGGSESMTHEDALQWVRDAKDSAPAGSGEVEALVQKWRDESESGFDGDGNLSDTWTAQAKRACADELAALLRKLQQGADYVMVPRVPTQEMLDAFCRLEPNEITEFHYYGGLTGYDHYTTEEGAKLAWETMIAASQGQEGGK